MWTSILGWDCACRLLLLDITAHNIKFYYQLGYSDGEFETLQQLIVLAVFNVVD